MVQFALYERKLDSKHIYYTCSVNSENNIEKVIRKHKDKSEGELYVIPINDGDGITHKFSNKEQIDNRWNETNGLSEELKTTIDSVLNN